MGIIRLGQTNPRDPLSDPTRQGKQRSPLPWRTQASLFSFWPNRPNVSQKSEARPIPWGEYYERLAAISLPGEFLNREMAVQESEKHSFGPNFWEGFSVVNQALEKREKRTVQVKPPVQADPW